MATKQELLNAADIVRKETNSGANSAERIGGLFRNIILSSPSQIINPEEKDRPMTAIPYTYDSEVYADADGRLWTHPQSIIDLDFELIPGQGLRNPDTLLTPGKVYKYSENYGRYPKKYTREVYLSVYRHTFVTAGRTQYDYRMQVKRYFNEKKYITEYRIGEYQGNVLNETCTWGEWKNAAPVHSFNNLYGTSAGMNASNVAVAIGGITSFDEFITLMKQGTVFIDTMADGSVRQCIVQSLQSVGRILVSYIDSPDEFRIYTLEWNNEEERWGLVSVTRSSNKAFILDIVGDRPLTEVTVNTPPETIKNMFGLEDDTFDAFLNAIRKVDLVRDPGRLTNVSFLAGVLNCYETYGCVYLTAYITTAANTPPKYVYWSFKNDNNGKVICGGTNL